MLTYETEILALTEESLNRYLQEKLAQGVAASAVAKYRTSLGHLLRWLGEDKRLTPLRLLQWRRAVEETGYRKVTVQHYVTNVNDYLRHMGHPELCIPKAFALDLRGQQFGYLTVLEPVEKRNRRDVFWRCQCKCGRETVVSAVSLRQGNTTSCGCLNGEILSYVNRYVEGTNLRHSMTDTPISTRSVSGYTGVYPKNGRWQARITYQRKTYILGTFSTLEEAVKARSRGKEWVMEDAARLYEASREDYPQTMPRRPGSEKKAL